MKGLLKKLLGLSLVGVIAVSSVFASFAADETPAGDEPTVGESVVKEATVWVNGKDVKANEKKGIVAAKNKTATLTLEEIGLNKTITDGYKYVISVTGTDVTDVAKAFDSKGKGLKSNLAKAAVKAKDSSVTITAGKEAGSAVIWVAEVDKKAKTVGAYAKINCTVKMAPSKFTIEVPKTGSAEAITKKTTLTVGSSVTLAVNVSKPETGVDESTTYTWSVKLPKNAAIDKNIAFEEGDTEGTCTFTFKEMVNATKAESYTITCVNDQSQKKSTFKVTVVNDITAVTIGDAETIAIADATEAKQTATVKATIATNAGANVADSTDKIKVYIAGTDKIGEGEGYTLTVGEKKDTFKLTTKSKEVSAKYKDGDITLTAKKGVAGKTVKLLVVVTHKDKTIDVYEKLVTVAAAADNNAGDNAGDAQA